MTCAFSRCAWATSLRIEVADLLRRPPGVSASAAANSNRTLLRIELQLSVLVGEQSAANLNGE